MNFLKLTLAFMFLLVMAFTGCDSSDPIVEVTDDDSVMDLDTTVPDPDLIPDPDMTPDPDEVPDPDLSDPTNCVEDSDCKTGQICVPESAGSTYGTCIAGCSSNDECSSGSCNLNLGRCVNTTGDSAKCSASSCAEGCCIAGDGMRSLTCAPVEDSRCSACGPCAQGSVCLISTSTCTAAECSSADQCATLNSHITDDDGKAYTWECNDGICAIAGGTDNDTDSGGTCVEEGGTCTGMMVQGDCCDGLICMMMCMAMTGSN